MKIWLYCMLSLVIVGLFSCSSEEERLSLYKNIVEEYDAAGKELGVTLLNGTIEQAVGTYFHYYASLPQQSFLKLEFTTETPHLKGFVELRSDGLPAKEFQLERRTSHSIDLSEFANKIVKISLWADFAQKDSAPKTRSEELSLEWSTIRLLVPADKLADSRQARDTRDYQTIQQRLKEYNVIYIVFDALHAKHSSLYGYPRKTTPFLDELARESIVFENMFANAPYTLASTANLLTGRHSFEHGLINQKTRLHPVLPTIGELLSAGDVESYLLTAHPFVGDDTWGLTRGFTSSFFRKYETTSIYFKLDEGAFKA